MYISAVWPYLTAGDTVVVNLVQLLLLKLYINVSLVGLAVGETILVEPPNTIIVVLLTEISYNTAV